MKTDERIAAETPGGGEAATETKTRNPFLRFLGEIPGLVLMALVLAILIKTFLVQAFYIPSPSMVPTLRQDDRVLVTRIPYYFGEPEVGDVIVFEDPDPSNPAPERGVIGGAMHWISQKLGVEAPDNEDFIKRVIGAPGDRITVKKGIVHRNGEPLDETYLQQEQTAWPSELGTVVVPDGMLFVLGDNRANSLDSRYGLGIRDETQGGAGFIPIDKVVGRAFVIVWPMSRWGGL